jgi:hypothetical protein
MFQLVEASSLAGSSCHMQGYLLTRKGMDTLNPINFKPIAGIDVGKFFSEMVIVSPSNKVVCPNEN